MESGKPKKQALAIAYSVKRRSKKMAKGGQVTAKDEKRPMPDDTSNSDPHVSAKGQRGPSMVKNDSREQIGPSKSKPSSSIEVDARKEKMSGIDDARTSEEMRMMRPSSDPMHINSDHDEDIADARLAHGGEIEDHYESIADAILAKKRKAKMMAEGGQVDLSRNADEDLNFEDQQSFKAGRKENYSESEGLEQLDSPMDSNEHSPEHEEMDIHDKDIVESIRRKKRAKL